MLIYNIKNAYNRYGLAKKQEYIYYEGNNCECRPSKRQIFITHANIDRGFLCRVYS